MWLLSRCDIETTDPWDWQRVRLEHECGPKQAERCNFFFSPPFFIQYVVLKVLTAVGRQTAAGKARISDLPLSFPAVCFWREWKGLYEFCMNVAHIHPSAEKCLILGEKMCSEMLFNLLWRILIGLGDLNQIFNYCMFRHIEKNLCIQQDCVCIYSGFCYCFVSLLNCWLIINQAVCVLVLRQQPIISERIVCSAVTDHSHDGLLRFVPAHKQKPQPVFVCALWFLCVHSRSSKSA